MALSVKSEENRGLVHVATSIYFTWNSAERRGVFDFCAGITGVKPNDTPPLELEDKSAPKTAPESAPPREASAEGSKAKAGLGNTAKLGCSPSARDHIDSLVKKLTAHGIRIDAAAFVNELVECFGQAGGYVAYTRRAGTLVSAKIVVEERIEGLVATVDLPLTIVKRQSRNPFAALKTQPEAKA